MEHLLRHLMLIQNIHLYHVQDDSDLERIRAKWQSRVRTVDSIPPMGAQLRCRDQILWMKSCE
jgi:hypothetical protein